MLDKMREHGGNWMVKLALGLVSLVFIFWGFGAGKLTGSADAYALKVNGTVITPDRYEKVYRNFENQQRQNKDLPEDMKEKYITQQAVGSSARTVAERGWSVNSAISPKLSPGPIVRNRESASDP